MADIKDIRALFKSMEEFGVAEVEIGDGKEKIVVRRPEERPDGDTPDQDQAT